MRVIVSMVVALLLTAGRSWAEPVPIRVAWTTVVTNLPSILLLKPGIARHSGVSYALVATHFGNTPLMLPALATDDIDIADLAYSSFAAGIEKAGMSDIRVIADEFQDGIDGYYSAEYMVRKDSPIEKIEDLKGKVLATSGIGGAMDVPMRVMLKKHGLDDKTDVTIVEIALPNHLAVLADHKVDLISSPLPFSQAPDLQKIGRTLFRQRDATGVTQMALWAARTGFIAKNRAALVDFLEDTIRVRRYFTDPANHDEIIKLVSEFTKLPPDHYSPWLFTKRDYYRDPNDEPNLDALQRNIDELARRNLLPTQVDVKQYADLGPVQAAAARVSSGK